MTLKWKTEVIFEYILAIYVPFLGRKFNLSVNEGDIGSTTISTGRMIYYVNEVEAHT